MSDIAFFASGNRRSRTLYGAFAQGLARHGKNLTVIHADNYVGIQSDIAVFYGLVGNLKRIYHEYRAAGKTTIFFDLGYWGRLDDGRYLGYHRTVVNGLHTTLPHDKKYSDDRWRQLGLFEALATPESGEYIILAGQSAKAAWVYDMAPEEWERAAIKKLREKTDLPIYYHPKLSWRDAKPIEGTIYWPHPIGELLSRAHALVTHHSNSSLAALANGVPVFMEDGIARSLAKQDLLQILEPRTPSSEEVNQLFAGAAYWQWKVSEIARGHLWSHLQNEGVV